MVDTGIYLYTYLLLCVSSLSSFVPSSALSDKGVVVCLQVISSSDISRLLDSLR